MFFIRRSLLPQSDGSFEVRHPWRRLEDGDTAAAALRRVASPRYATGARSFTAA